jgi:hypothetical protein
LGPLHGNRAGDALQQLGGGDFHDSGLTLELSRPRRQAPTGRGRTMIAMAWSGQAAPAIAGRLERGVRRHRGTVRRHR